MITHCNYVVIIFPPIVGAVMHTWLSWTDYELLRSPSLSVQPVKCVSAALSSERSLSECVLHRMIRRRSVAGHLGWTAASILSAHQVTSTFTSDRHWARWPSQSIWVNLEGQEQGDPLLLTVCDQHTIWFIYCVSFLSTLKYLLSHRYGSSIYQALTRNWTFKCCSWVLPNRMWLHHAQAELKCLHCTLLLTSSLLSNVWVTKLNCHPWLWRPTKHLPTRQNIKR